MEKNKSISRCEAAAMVYKTWNLLYGEKHGRTLSDAVTGLKWDDGEQCWAMEDEDGKHTVNSIL